MRAVNWPDRLLGAAVVVMAAQEYLAGHLGVHAGELYGRRPGFLPLLPAGVMIALWLIQAAAGFAMLSGLAILSDEPIVGLSIAYLLSMPWADAV